MQLCNVVYFLRKKGKNSSVLVNEELWWMFGYSLQAYPQCTQSLKGTRDDVSLRVFEQPPKQSVQSVLLLIVCCMRTAGTMKKVRGQRNHTR